MSSSKPAIRVASLRKSYRSLRTRHEVLKGVDLEISRGEVVGLIGPNGAGKTTLMSCLLGFLFPDGGDISIDGHRPDDLDVRRRCGFVPERVGFERGTTAEAFLRYMGRLSGVTNLENRVDLLLERFDLEKAGTRRLSAFSRGMLQRVAMCQAILHEPDFLLLDEPTSGLDPGGMILFRKVIDAERERGATVLLNSHQLSEVEKICDRVVFLSGGRITAEQSLRAVEGMVVVLRFLEGDNVRERIIAAGLAIEESHALLHVQREEEIPPVLERLLADGIPIVEVRPRSAGLERYFKENG